MSKLLYVSYERSYEKSMSIEILCNPMADLGGVLFNCTVIFSLALLNVVYE